MIPVAMLLAISGGPWYSCDYAYAAKRDAPIHEAHATIKAPSERDANKAIRKMVEAAGFILEGSECKEVRGEP